MFHPDMHIRALIIGDEAATRHYLRRRLEQEPDFSVVGDCADDSVAFRAIESLSPDVLFVDLRMPALSGLEFIQKSFPIRAPRVICISSCDQHAVRAFEVNALDYLLKPIDDERFNDTLSRIRNVVRAAAHINDGHSVSDAVTRISHNLLTSNKGPLHDRIAIPLADRVIIIRACDVDWVGADGNYVSIHSAKKAWLLRETISSMDAKLSQLGFIRIHRCTLVNSERIVELRTSESGFSSVSLRDGTSLKLSRTYRDAVDDVFWRDVPDHHNGRGCLHSV